MGVVSAIDSIAALWPADDDPDALAGRGFIAKIGDALDPVFLNQFGNLLDPESDVRKVLATKRVFRFKEEYGTYPKFFYYIG